MKRFNLIPLAVAASAALAVWLGWPATPVDRSAFDQTARQPAARRAEINHAQVRRAALARAEASLAWADEQSREAVALQLASLDEFFAEAQRGAPAFADEVLGWGSKWRFVADKVPFTEGGRHAAFLRQAFARHLFQAADLTHTIEQSLVAYADSLAAIENQMLVRIRQDVSDLPATALPEFADQATLLSAYDQAVAKALAHVRADVSADVAALITSVVAEEVLAQVAVRLGVSAGVLSAGAGSSWATLGAGLLVGLIVDQLITWVWDWWSDPRGSLAAEMNVRLDQLHDLIVLGDGTSPGLRGKLEQFAARRADMRRQALRTLLELPSQGATP